MSFLQILLYLIFSKLSMVFTHIKLCFLLEITKKFAEKKITQLMYPKYAIHTKIPIKNFRPVFSYQAKTLYFYLFSEHSTAARIKSLNSLCALLGLDLNSGWN